MDIKFAALVERLHPAYVTLISRAPVMGGATPSYAVEDRIAKRGVYLFTERGRHLYVGRSNRLFDRYKNHWEPQKTERQAAFAFKLAREAAGFTKAAYKKGPESRRGLMLNPIFNNAFLASRAFSDHIASYPAAAK